MNDTPKSGPTASSIDDMSAYSGLEMVRAVVSGAIAQAPISIALNMPIVSASLGETVFEGAPGPNALNPFGPVHGGWYGTILDNAMGAAVYTMVPAGSASTTLEFKVNVIRAIPVGTPVRATGTASHVGRSSGVAEGKLVGIEDGRLYATGSTTCLVFTPNKKSV